DGSRCGHHGSGPAMSTTTTPGTDTGGEVGQARLRKEDRRLLTGRTRWTDNLTLPGMMHQSVLRSPVAHARLAGHDTQAARDAPGVVGVWTGADLPEHGQMPTARTVSEDMLTPQFLPLSVGAVKHVGDIIAVVAAASKEEADDAIELIDVDYQDLPVITDPVAALAEGAPLVHPELGINVCATWELDSGTLGTGGS